MLRQSLLSLAKVYGAVPPLGAAQGHRLLHGKREREGSLFAVANDVKRDERLLRQQLNALLEEERMPMQARLQRSEAVSSHEAVPQTPLVDLPGVERRRDLPADPITRLFFQHKGDHALYYGTYDKPSVQDDDRVQIEKRVPRRREENLYTPIYDFCHRIREATEQRKRFVVVPSTIETRGCARVMHDHGLVAGFRDFHNDRAFAVELKYFQGDSTINVIEPCSYDGRTEFEWSPKMMRRLLNTHGIHNRLVVYICRTADNRIIDHIHAVKENIGGRGLMMVH
ncbi:30S ribosomal protein S8, putative [Trypanosoma equiperdum]|uniref:30S ribosomal protein S8, putative n=2 Tax=Trypanozoon TaxID=39700 RepID=Q388R7_TRYB2|nr:30S ribosomal protein S8, putative [Trypanosoma brucei brucei TREU927]EAN78703.1 30S ribosomal protein S8, putative [Trypanosoma brucei brucei TREU927]SCU72653.1 30S ribosomal protein S8, putative [Trypanosoma equiperdum]